MMIVFGSSFAHLILLKYGGSSLADGVGPWLLRAHSVCVWFMAINGVTEAFVFASMKPDELDKRNRKMVVLSFVYIGSAWLLSRAFVCLLVRCLSVCRFVCLLVRCLSVCRFAFPFVCHSVGLAYSLFLCLLSVCLPVCLCAPSVILSFCLPVNLPFLI